MKKRLYTLLALSCALGLLLSACGGEAVKPFEPDTTSLALLTETVFTDPEDMQPPLEPTLLFDRLDPDSLTAGAAYSSTYTAELAAVLVLTDDAAAEKAETVLKDYLAAQIEQERSYRPDEASKLDTALLERRANTLLLVVAKDAAAAQAALDSWSKE